LSLQASTPSSSLAPEVQDIRGAEHDQSRDVLVHDEAINSGRAGVNYRVRSVILVFIFMGILLMP